MQFTRLILLGLTGLTQASELRPGPLRRLDSLGNSGSPNPNVTGPFLNGTEQSRKFTATFRKSLFNIPNGTKIEWDLRYKLFSPDGKGQLYTVGGYLVNGYDKKYNPKGDKTLSFTFGQDSKYTVDPSDDSIIVYTTAVVAKTFPNSVVLYINSAWNEIWTPKTAEVEPGSNITSLLTTPGKNGAKYVPDSSEVDVQFIS